MRLLPRLLVLAAALLLPAWAACAGDDNERTASIIHRLLLAAVTDTSGELESFAGRLPDGLPVEPPQYPDAEVVLSNRQPAPLRDSGGALDLATPAPETPQPMLYLIVLDTPDGREQVFDFYEQALDEDPWQLEASFSSEQLDTLQFSDVDDADISGVVSIARGGEDDRTSILISLQDAGAFRREEPPFELGESLPLPKEFPSDVPSYEGATVTQTAFFREPGNQSFLLIFLTTDSQDDVIEFYRQEFQKHGWSVLSGAPFGLAERIDFRDERRDIQGDVLANRFDRDRRYTEVRVQVRENPAREPAGDGERPTAAPTEEGAIAAPPPDRRRPSGFPTVLKKEECRGAVPRSLS